MPRNRAIVRLLLLLVVALVLQPGVALCCASQPALALPSFDGPTMGAADTGDDVNLEDCACDHAEWLTAATPTLAPPETRELASVPVPHGFVSRLRDAAEHPPRLV